MATLAPLPLEETVAPADQSAVAEVVRNAAERETAVYPIGGGTSLGLGAVPKVPGIGLSLAGLNRLVDYPARDMTVTVEAGMTMAELACTLASEGQRLPIDVPHAEQATLGGVIATDCSGPRRYGFGTLRDYVIGISAVDGRGTPFKGGGRVVKNVAGYDFCKLLTGSLGTLGVITQVTLKVKPTAEQSMLVACDLTSFEQAEPLLAALVTSQTTPAAIELLAGPAWRSEAALQASSDAAASLVVGLEGTARETEWMVRQLQEEWRSQGVEQTRTFAGSEADLLWQRLTEFPADEGARLVIKATMLPRHVAEFCAWMRRLAPDCSLQAHAGSGVVLVRLSELPDDPAKLLIREIQPQAIAWGGSAVVLEYRGEGELTRQAIWGGRSAAVVVMEAVKQQFDPHGLLNPGRFVYSDA